MKKTFQFVFICLVLWGFSINTVIAQSIDQFRFSSDTTGGIAGIKLTNFNGSGSAEIPLEVNGLPVRVLGRSIFVEKRLDTITIHDNIVTIENDAFRGNLLTSLTIPNSVTSIGESAFKNNLLSSVTISNTITSISNWAFQNNLITSIIIPNSVTSIGRDAFLNNPITSITIGANVRMHDNSFPGNFRKVYKNTSGTYTRPNANSTQWTRRR